MAWVAIYRLHQGIGLEAFWRVQFGPLFTIWMYLREWRDRGPKRKREESEDTVIVTAP
jgi:hypothetical protein